MAEFDIKFVSTIVMTEVLAEFGTYRTDAEVYATLVSKVQDVNVKVAELFKELATKKAAPRDPA